MEQRRQRVRDAGIVGTDARACTTDAARAADKIRIGEGPFITGGAFYIARDKGYFQKLDLDIESRSSWTARCRCPRWWRASSTSPR